MGKLVRKELLETLGNGNKDKMSPVFLLIIHKNGILLHAKEFSQDVSKPFDLIGGFLGALDSFSRDAFSRSLDRIRLGEYTVVMLPLGSLLLALANINGYGVAKYNTIMPTMNSKNIVSNVNMTAIPNVTRTKPHPKRKKM